MYGMVTVILVFHTCDDVLFYFPSVCLLFVDVGNVNSRNIRFANYLRNLLPSNDIGVMRYAAKTVGRLAQISGTFSAEYADFEMKKAIEWLGGDRVEGKRHAAVSDFNLI